MSDTTPTIGIRVWFDPEEMWKVMLSDGDSVMWRLHTMWWPPASGAIARSSNTDDVKASSERLL